MLFRSGSTEGQTGDTEPADDNFDTDDTVFYDETGEDTDS